MRVRSTETVFVGWILCVVPMLTWTAEAPPSKTGPVAAAPSENAVATQKNTAPVAEPVDINSASKADLMKLPGIGPAEADKVIAGRPYLSKAHLQTRNIVSPTEYQALRELVVARQKDAKFGNPVVSK